MALRRLLESYDESVQEMELAAGQKFREALELQARGRWGGAVYLGGYTAEMLLKCAYCYSRGAAPSDLVAPYFGPARSLLKVWYPGLNARSFSESYHSLLFWWYVLRAARRSSAPLAAQLESQVQQRVRRIYLCWWVEMRYRQDRADAATTGRFLEDVMWLRDHYRALRS